MRRPEEPEENAQHGRQGKALPDAPVTVVIVHWNQPERCVRTGRAFMGQQGVDAHLIVVDNGSAPAAASEVAAGLPAAELVRVGRNAGFGAAANVGVRRWL